MNCACSAPRTQFTRSNEFFTGIPTFASRSPCKKNSCWTRGAHSRENWNPRASLLKSAHWSNAVMKHRRWEELSFLNPSSQIDLSFCSVCLWDATSVPMINDVTLSRNRRKADDSLKEPSPFNDRVISVDGSDKMIKVIAAWWFSNTAMLLYRMANGATVLTR